MKSPKVQLAGLSLITGMLLMSLSGCQKENPVPSVKGKVNQCVEDSISNADGQGKGTRRKSLSDSAKMHTVIMTSGDSTGYSGGDSGGPKFPPH